MLHKLVIDLLGIFRLYIDRIEPALLDHAQVHQCAFPSSLDLLLRLQLLAFRAEDHLLVLEEVADGTRLLVELQLLLSAGFLLDLCLDLCSFLVLGAFN